MTLPTRWPMPADPEPVRLGWEHWSDRVVGHAEPAIAAFGDRARRDPALQPLLDMVFGGSPHLTGAVLAEPGQLQEIADRGVDDAFSIAVQAVVTEAADARDTKRLMAVLRRFKRRAGLAIAIADLGEIWSIDRTCMALSTVAETALRLASRHLLRQIAEAGALCVDTIDEPELGSGLIVLAMGKLGARELNYSSDIDLVILYDDGRVRAPDPDNMARTFIRLTRDLVRIMEERTHEGYVFRTDLRLRPDPGATPPAVSVTAAEAYYGSLAQNWERAAMIKARPVAGDPAACEQFARFLGQFVWRRDLDFAALEDIHGIKRQIHQYKGHAAIAVDGHDIKLGRGGIREIEFFAQTQQLIYGGRSPTLRASRTVDTLAALAQAGRFERDSADQLVAAYWELRRIEHRLQMVDDRQTHVVPTDPPALERFVAFLGDSSVDAFRERLRALLTRVEASYARLFPVEQDGAPPEPAIPFIGGEDDSRALAMVSDHGFADAQAVVGVVRGWLHGRYRSTRSERARRLLGQLLPRLLAAFGATANPDMAWRSMDEFLARLPAGIQVFSMFAANPNLLDLIATILGTSQRLSHHLAHRPSQLDAVLEPGFFDPPPAAPELEAELQVLLGSVEDYEDVLDVVRRWTNDKRFQAGIHLLLGIGDAAGEGARFLTDVSEVAVRALLDRVQTAFEARHGGFGRRSLAVVALGKLGSREMTIRSDLDLIMVYDAPETTAESDGAKPLAAPVYFARLIQRFLSAVTAQTREGALFEVDMRLRPSGNAGPLATSLAAFSRYHQVDSWTWEHQALTRARVIAGPPDLCAAIDGAIAGTLRQPRDADGLRRQVSLMRGRIGQEHPATDIWNVKYLRGGLVDIEFIAQYLQLLHGAGPSPAFDPNTRAALDALADAGHLGRETAAELGAILSVWQRIQAYLRLTQDGVFDPEQAPEPLRRGLIRAALAGDGEAVDFDGAVARLSAMAERGHRSFREIVGDETLEP